MQTFLSSALQMLKYTGFVLVGSFVLSTGVEAADRMITLPSGAVGVSYTYTFLADAGFSEPYTWQISTSTMTDVLPPGLFVSTAGSRELRLSGTPTRVGTYQFTVAPYSSNGTLLPTTLATLEIRGERITPLIVNGTGSRTGIVGVPFSSDPILRLEGGAPPSEWRLISGGLPSGLQFTSQGAIQGTATAPGTYVFQAEVFDVLGFRSTTSVRVMVSEGTSMPSSGSVLGTMSSPPPSSGVPASSLSYSDRWNLLNRLGLASNMVIRTDYLDPLMLRPLHYYVGADGRRHIFQSDAVYYSWYPSLSSQTPRVMGMQDVASIPLGEPITYHPGERVRFRTDMSTYGVAGERAMWRLPSDTSTASGWTWERGVEELDETHFTVYRLMDGVASVSSYDPARLRSQYTIPNSVLPMTTN